MPTFSYKALDKNNNEVNGTLEANDEKAVLSHLKDMGCYVTEIKEIKPLKSDILRWASEETKSGKMAKLSRILLAHGLGILGLGIVLFSVITGPSLKTYQSMVYGNPEITTIIQQNFIANEFTFRILYVLNQAIVGLALILLGLIVGANRNK